MEKTVQVECKVTFEFTYDPETEAFKQTLADYREVIVATGDEDEIITQAAYLLIRYGSVYRLLEGIGYVKLKGMAPNEVREPWSGITVTDDDPDFEYNLIKQ